MLLLLTGGFQVIGAAHSYEITLNVKNEPLESVMLKIRKQTGYSVVFSDTRISAKPLTVNIYKQPLEVALDIIFKDQPLSYLIREKAIIVLPKTDETVGKKKTEQPISDSSVKAQENLTGSVVDSVGMGLPGVTVVVKGSSKSTSTDDKGKFVLYNTPATVTLRFSLIGFEAKEVSANGSSNIKITLNSTASKLNEVVIKGYYTTSKTLNTGSVGGLKAIDIAKQPVSNPLMALQGRIPGLSIVQSSGVPGSELYVSIRGRNSMANGNVPMYIVDGVPFNAGSLKQNSSASSGLSPFMSIRPEDIESIDVLKDADATAIYGSRGANGVILITTKKGQAGKTKVDFTVNHGASTISRFLDLMDTQQYLEMRREAYRNDGLAVPDKSTTATSTNYDLTAWDSSRYTDWQKLLIGGTARTTNASGSISGGNSNIRFLLGLNYREETTVYPGDSKNQIASGNLNVNYLSDNKRFKADISVNLSSNKNKLPVSDLTRNIFLAPNAPAIYGADGKLNWENSTFDNPFQNILRPSSSTMDNLINNIRLSYQITGELSLGSSFGYNYQIVSEKQLTPFSSYNPVTLNPEQYRSHTRARMQVKSWIVEPQLNYKKDLGNHHLEGLFGLTFQSSSQSGLQETATGFSTDALLANFASGTTKFNFNDTDVQYRYSAAFARIGYNYKEKYILNLTGRRDGSSRFGPKTRFGNFGAVGAAWNFGKEPFATPLSFLSQGKLRASYGRTGNDQFADYGYFSNYNTTPLAYQGLAVLSPSGLTNPYYGWETIDKLEVALETGFLKNRITANIGYYNNRTKNQLVGFVLSTVTGYATVKANLPAEIENKGWEIDLNTVNVQTKSLSWTSSFNISFPKSKLISFPGLEQSGYSNQYAIGQPLGLYFAYKYKGIDQGTGLYTFEDINKDGSIGTADLVPNFVGQKFYGGLGNTFSYKEFTVDFFFQFVKQTGYSGQVNTLAGYFGLNQLTSLEDRWQSAGKDAQFQRYSTLPSAAYRSTQNFSGSDAMITDASFIRLKNVALGWTLPEKWRAPLKLSYARIFLQAQNLFTITNYKGISLDPEGGTFQRSYTLAPLRTIVAGLQLTF